MFNLNLVLKEYFLLLRTHEIDKNIIKQSSKTTIMITVMVMMIKLIIQEHYS